MIQSASLPNTINLSEGRKRLIYHQYFTLVGRRILMLTPAVHLNLIRTSLFSISKYGKITGKAVHSNHFFKAEATTYRGVKLGPEGGFEPDLNGYLTSTTESVPPVGVELESNCSRATVNLHFLSPFPNIYLSNIVSSSPSPNYLVPNYSIPNLEYRLIEYRLHRISIPTQTLTPPNPPVDAPTFYVYPYSKFIRWCV